MDGSLSGAGAGAEEGISSFAEKNPAKHRMLGSETPGSQLAASFFFLGLALSEFTFFSLLCS